ncbi:hypothetical protein BKA83DRAFT_677975 [Pisolithus microcarpus]|nr:hypothetical protein BKA83DRAFT_677975 [Pisolithus microcarpus]
MQLAALSVLTVAAFIPQAFSWGAVGHEVVATVAQMHLHPSDDVSDYDGSCHLATVATWAGPGPAGSKVPVDRPAPLTLAQQMTTLPLRAHSQALGGWEGRTHINVLSIGVAAAYVDGYVQDALKFLIHFLGDMHQPLHLTGRDRGGNGDKVSFDGRPPYSHNGFAPLPMNYTRPLPLPGVEDNLRGTIYDPYIRRLVWEGILGKYEHELSSWLTCPAPERLRVLPLPKWQRVLLWLFGSKSKDGGLDVDDEFLCPYHWARPIHSLNCEIVWPAELDQPPYNRISYTDVDRSGHLDEDTFFVDMDDPKSTARRKNSYLELDTPQYAGRIRDEWIVEKLLAQGGIRLAAVLNWLFADFTDGNSGHLVIREL